MQSDANKLAASLVGRYPNMTPTEKYIEENKYVHGLRRSTLGRGEHRRIILDSVRHLLWRNVLSLFRCAKNYPLELYKGFSGLKATYGVAGSKSSCQALVIGNGPSQGYLDSKTLDKFIENGGETICVNYWNLNKSLASHIPTWMCFSDSLTFKSEQFGPMLIEYLRENSLIKIVGPRQIIEAARQSGLTNSMFSFIDIEVPCSRNLHPLMPRGYISMTLYKALAWGVYLGYSKIGLIGMDNTYPRNLYCDENNNVLNLETHAGKDDFVVDQSSLYPTMASALQELFLIFRDLERFPQRNIVNLDRYSLTDRFKKVEPQEFFDGC